MTTETRQDRARECLDLLALRRGWGGLDGLGERARRCLRQQGIDSLTSLRDYLRKHSDDPRGLLRIHKLGRTTEHEILRWLREVAASE